MQVFNVFLNLFIISKSRCFEIRTPEIFIVYDTVLFVMTDVVRGLIDFTFFRLDGEQIAALLPKFSVY